MINYEGKENEVTSYWNETHTLDKDDDDDGVLKSHKHSQSNLKVYLNNLVRQHPEFAEHLSSPGWVTDFHLGDGHSDSSLYSGHFSEGSGYFGDSEASNNQNQPQPRNHHHHHQQQQPQPKGQQPNWYSTLQSQENVQENKVDNDNTCGQSSDGCDTLSQYGLKNNDPEIKLKGQSAAKEDRNQKLLSAPPDGRSQINTDKPQRFVSKIEINSVNPATGQSASSNNDSCAGKPPMAPLKKQQSQPQHQVLSPPPQKNQSNVEHTPLIFIEDRNESVLPNIVNQEFSMQTSRQQQCFSSPQQHFHQHQLQPFHHGHHHGSHHHHNYHHKHRHHHHYGHHHSSQQHHNHSQRSQASPSQYPNRNQSQEQPQHLQNKHHENVQNQPQTESNQEVNDVIYQIQLIKKKANEVRQKINDYKGNSRSDKEFIYLDEMLTRNLITLDNIETEGKENVRAARKEAIKCIQQCISILESKVPQMPVLQTPSSSNVGADNEKSNNKMDVDINNKNADTSSNTDESKNNNEKCNDSEKENTSPAKELCGDVQKMVTDEYNKESSNKNDENNRMSINEEQQQVQKCNFNLKQKLKNLLINHLPMMVRKTATNASNTCYDNQN
ncbi:uncharacterized protein LOC142329717 [Lycorma delicatula]|uniref:uncharacterized protein LOC142329717 n=1 Tax=Lycorma delicatula TaxID=130591 RepID=UPI003F5116AB